MTTLANAEQSAKAFISSLDTQTTVWQELLKDKSFPLEDRWNFYILVEDYLPGGGSFICKSIDVLTDCLYDDLNMERYETRKNSSIDENLLENQPLEEPNEDSDMWEHKYYKRAKRMWEKRDEWREAVLAEGYGGFTYDW